MISIRARAMRLCLNAAALTLAGVLLANPVAARDGVNDCAIAEVETDEGRVWRHKLEVQIPEDGYCRIYIGDDKDPKSWKYCWLKRASDNPVSGTCDDPIDNEDFDVWKAKAVCGNQNLIAYCRRETPLVPLPR